MKRNLHILFFLLASISVRAQFPQNANQTFYVCDTIQVQSGVRAFADGNGGTYSFWTDIRNGSTAPAVFGQHLDSLGNPLWPVNGKNIVSIAGRQIWNMNAIKWQSGILIAWIQGIGGGDSLYANYYDLNGAALWAQPTLVANRQAGVLYVEAGELDLFPNSKGAIIGCALEPFGNDVFNFNRIDFSGNLFWPLDSIRYTAGGLYSFIAADDHHDGIYIATSTGGLGSPINVGHYDGNGVSTITTPVVVSAVAGGRANDPWNIICDSEGNAYVVWDDNTNANVHVAKVKADGNLPWGGSGDKSICSFAGYQAETYAMIDNDTIYAIWDDARPGATNQFDIYMQKLDTAGNTYWTTGGIQLSNLTSYIPYPRLVKTGNNVVATFVANSNFRGQKIRPDSSIVWQANGIAINNPNPPFYGDYVLVATGGENVTAIWSDEANIMAARIRPDGTLTHVQQLNKNLMGVYPNPVADNFTVQLGQQVASPLTISIYNSLGELMQQNQFTNNINGDYLLSTNNLSSGIYFVKVNGQNYYSSSKICVIKN